MQAPDNVDPIADIGTAMNVLNTICADPIQTHEQITAQLRRTVDSLLHPTLLTLQAREQPKPVPMLLWCPAPECGARHIDLGEFEHKPHHTHSCQQCGMTWRPAIVPTVGVRFLPGFKNTDQRPPPPLPSEPVIKNS